jgi:drug/metabolite transporter (DMT)-like permease
LYVPLAAVLDLVIYGERLSAWQTLGLAVALLGVLIVVTDHKAAAAGRPLDPRAKRQGIWLSLGVAVTIACAVVLGHGESSACGVLPMATLRMAGGVLGALPIALALGARRRRVGAELASISEPLRRASARPRALWIACALALTGLFPYHFAMRELPGGVGAILFATTPLFTLVLGRLSGEHYGVRGLSGTLIGFAGVALIVLAT